MWEEIDLNLKLWTIPAARMKARQPHTVPMSDRALHILQQARALHSGQVIFPGVNGQPLSDNTLSKLMRDAGVSGTPHGFRSSFKDWAAENGVRDEVSETALAHFDKNAVRAAYRRTRYLEERVGLMQWWADFVGDIGQANEKKLAHG